MDLPLVLLVEDEPLLRAIARDELLDAGLEVIEAGSGDDACAIIAQAYPLCALFTDIRLGAGPDGWAVAKAFRVAYPRGAVIYASGFAPGEPQRVDRSVFVQKPYRLTSIAVILHGMIQASAAAGA